MLGLSIYEREGAGLKQRPFLPSEKPPAKLKRRNMPDTFKIIWQGSYPDAVYRDEKSRKDFYDSYIRAYLERDVKQLINVGDEVAFLTFLKVAAARTGQELNVADIAKDVGISQAGPRQRLWRFPCGIFNCRFTAARFLTQLWGFKAKFTKNAKKNLKNITFPLTFAHFISTFEPIMKTIFVVDDNAANLAVAKQVLSESGYRVLTLPSAEKMFALFVKIMPDIILMDIEMPEMDGFAAMEKLKTNDKLANIPVMFLTASSDVNTEAKGLKLGAVDFVVKPFSPPVLLNRIANHLHIDEMIKKRTEQLEQRTKQIEQLQNGIVFTIANIVESRDKITGGHIERTSRYIKILMDAMLTNGLYLEEMIEWDLNMVVASARLHDVGKIAISDLILNKPEKLSADEFIEMRKHSEEGELIIEQITKQTGNALFLYHAKLFAGSHHERWNGTGYPRGLKEETIPLQGRIMAIADVYDALASKRPYKPAFSCEEAEAIIIKDSGTFFDPKIVEIFREVKEQFREITKEQF